MTRPVGRTGAISAQSVAVASMTSGPSDLRTGTVVAVTSRGINVAVAGGLVENAAHLSSYNPAVGDPVALLRFQDSWLVLDRPVGPGTATDLATPGSGLGTTLLGGTVLSGSNTTMASTTGGPVTVPRYRCTYFHPPGHQVLILCGFTWYCSVAADTMEVMLFDAVSGQQGGSMVFNQSSNNFFSRFETNGQMFWPQVFGGRKVDVYMQIQRLNGTGTSRIDDAALRRGYMVALDMGDSSVIATV